MVIIKKVGDKTFEDGVKTRVRYPSMLVGSIQLTFNARETAEAYIKTLIRNQRIRAKMTNA